MSHISDFYTQIRYLYMYDSKNTNIDKGDTNNPLVSKPGYWGEDSIPR